MSEKQDNQGQNEYIRKLQEAYDDMLKSFFVDLDSEKLKNAEKLKAEFINGLRDSNQCYFDEETQVEWFNRLSIEVALDFGIRLGYEIYNKLYTIKL